MRGAESRKARHLAKGQAFLVDGNFEKARVEFRNALQIAPNDSEARYENGVVDEKLGNPREPRSSIRAPSIPTPTMYRLESIWEGCTCSRARRKTRLKSSSRPWRVTPTTPAYWTVRAAARTAAEGSGCGASGCRARRAPGSDKRRRRRGTWPAFTNLKDKPTRRKPCSRTPSSNRRARWICASLWHNFYASPGTGAASRGLADRPRTLEGRMTRPIDCDWPSYYARLNHIDEAERVLREAIKSLPNEHELKTDLVQFLVARRGRDAGAKELSAMIAADPKDYELKFAQASFYEQGKGRRKRQEHLQGSHRGRESRRRGHYGAQSAGGVIGSGQRCRRRRKTAGRGAGEESNATTTP